MLCALRCAVPYLLLGLIECNPSSRPFYDGAVHLDAICHAFNKPAKGMHITREEKE